MRIETQVLLVLIGISPNDGLPVNLQGSIIKAVVNILIGHYQQPFIINIQPAQSQLSASGPS